MSDKKSQPAAPAQPPSPIDAALWDKACELASSTRGLGFEALAESSPIERRGETFVCACPHAALRCPAAEASAAKSLAEAFGMGSAKVSLVEEAPAGAHPSWRSRSRREHELSEDAAFEAFLREDLSQTFSNSFGAVFSRESFDSGKKKPK